MIYSKKQYIWNSHIGWYLRSVTSENRAKGAYIYPHVAIVNDVGCITEDFTDTNTYFVGVSPCFVI